MPTTDSVIPTARRTGGLCLALSGGGFRATLFHLGSLRRLNELGLIATAAAISSVSGGSIMAACLADAMIASPPGPGKPLVNFDALVAKVHALTSYNLRRTILLKKAEPWHWKRSLADLVAQELEQRVTSLPLTALPDRPRFLFTATDMVFGVDWIYSKDMVGDYQAGYKRAGLDSITIAHAAAASACFPPVFAPLDPLVKGSELIGGAARGPEADQCRDRIRLSDGGVYDNMGLEPVWKNAETLLVSDAGGPFELSRDRGTIADIKRYPDIMGNQALALRKRWLIASFEKAGGPGSAPGLTGTYWDTGLYRARYANGDSLGYSKEIASLISHIRTDLDAFSDGEARILENHGYLIADIALEVRVPSLYVDAPKPIIPYPEWMAESRVREALEGSSTRRYY
ncbi:MAG: putative esterase of the alpha-beta hydrolase superfamily [Gemmatimonadetes bacterium]|nr:putative esterase of the alpha-beta hydrolase superfamily [Gemmatimonadota bacterium]